MTPDEIRAAISASPAIKALIPDTVAIAAALSVGRTKVASRFASERGILERFPGGPMAADALLAKLEAFAVSGHPMARIVGRAIKFLEQPEGLDIGASTTQGLLDQLAAGGVITQTERDGLRAMATVDDPVSEMSVRSALFADDGSLRV